MKTMDKAKFKAQKITSKAQSEQFILSLGDIIATCEFSSTVLQRHGSIAKENDKARDD